MKPGPEKLAKVAPEKRSKLPLKKPILNPSAGAVIDSSRQQAVRTKTTFLIQAHG